MVETNFNQDEDLGFPDTKESIELTKNSRGFNWKIKLKSDFLDEKDLERLDKLNKYFQVAYGNEGSKASV